MHIEVTKHNDNYNADDDLRNSILEAFRVIKERMKSGGPGWEPHKYHPLIKDSKPQSLTFLEATVQYLELLGNHPNL